MARQCKICKKGTVTAHRVSHSNIKTKRRVYANLQKVRTLFAGKVQRIMVCTRCIRSGWVQKAL